MDSEIRCVEKELGENMYYYNPNIAGLYRTESMETRNGYVRLDMNENPEGLPEEFVRKVCQEITPEYLSRYPETMRLTDLLASYYQVDREQICLTNGSDEGVRLIFEVFTHPGGKVITTDPTFAMYEVYCNMYGRIQEKVSYNEAFKISVDSVLEKIGQETELIIIVNPDNPMGFQFKEEDILRIIERAKENEAMVMIDEAYVQFSQHTFLNFLSNHDNVIVLRTFSKLFSLAACRLGVAISNVNNSNLMKKAMSSYNVNGIAIKFAERIIEEHLEEQLLKIQLEGKRYLIECLMELGYSCKAAEGNFVFIKTKGQRDQVAAELKKKMILVKSYQNYALKDYIRVTTGSKEIMGIFINVLKEVDYE